MRSESLYAPENLTYMLQEFNFLYKLSFLKAVVGARLIRAP